ncbi:MAG: hypothetical protein GXO39_05425 [Thermotogae bacterium]|nr:hypothetical protein [Thermotogota bacterium]
MKTREALIKKLEPIKSEFISQFKAYVKEVLSSQKRILDLSYFVFPAFTKEEWAQLWRDLGADEDGGRVDLRRLNVGIRFYRVVFLEETRFIFWNFGDGVFFDKAQIYATINFNGAQFGNKVSFVEAIFKFDGGDINFQRVKFGDGVWFDKAEIYSPISFNGAQFGNQVSFVGTIFTFDEGEVNFVKAKFGDGIFFDKAQIYSPTSFNGAQFGNQVSFVGTIFEFNEEINFNGVKFGDGVFFAATNIPSNLSLFYSSIGGSMIFERIVFKNNAKILLENLTFISDGHIRTDIQTMERIIWKGSNLFQDHPRVFLTAEEDAIHGWDRWPPRFSQEDWQNRLGKLVELWGSLEEAERIYRQVRLIMEYNGRFSDAGELYIMEMYLRTIRLLNGDGSKRNSGDSEMGDKSFILSNYPLIFLLRNSFDQSKHVVRQLVVFIVSNLLFLLSFMILPLVSVWDFLRKKISPSFRPSFTPTMAYSEGGGRGYVDL